MAITIGIDIGGSHITAAVVDLEKNSIIPSTHVRARIDSTADAKSIIKAWSKSISESFEGFDGPVNLGFAMPGPFNYGEGISLIKEQGKYVGLYGLNIKNMLREEFGNRINQITFTNDALCFLIGEVKVQNHSEHQHILGLTLGTGLGSTYFDEDIFVDADLWNAPFLNGIAEDYFATRWFVKNYYQRTGIEVKGVQEMLESSIYHKIVQQIFNEFGTNLCAFITEIAARRPVQKVIIGGNIAKTYRLFAHELEDLPFEIVCSVLGEEAALIGAAMIEQEDISTKIDFLSIKSHHV